MKKNVFFWSVVVALGGLLFGFDTAVISGAEKSVQALWQLSAYQHGLTMSIALIGTVIGAIFGSVPSDRLGRRTTLSWIAVLYLVSAVGAALSPAWVPFMVFRFLGGLGVGASSVTAPLYISEVSPPASRGRMVGMFQFNVVLGILLAFLSNYLLAGVGGEQDWRWMLGVQAVPALAFFLLLFRIPESPRWLIRHDRPDEARAVFERIDPATAEENVSAILVANATDQGSDESLWARPYRRPVILAMLFAAFNQLSGINAIIYYAPRIFEMTGRGESAALLSSAGVGLVNFCFTLLAVNVIDRFGRRRLMLVGSLGLILTLGLVARAFYSQEFGAVPLLLFAYIAFFAFSQGAVIWVFISEIFPSAVRAKGQALGSSTHWVLAAAITFIFPALADKLGGGNTFAFFGVMMVLQLLYVWKLMPETKGKTLEDADKILVLH
ncbi:sugar porter family MFS transporter [Hymenobacter aerilatus]|uniref:Sugar porter family MFS transporter n=1 Tax=Hymenobacter aerilatus TaxID=2932251 RepID=A0A8T9SVA1_9BACT|nr:sugar porter family MFS transporter [Hymenobacter aerilatus]UOR03706.1 sugar porter family MFS transporter [Hymenobacter aerilatus]